MSDHGLFSSSRANKERRTRKIRGPFSGIHRTLDGWVLTRAPASPAQGLHHDVCVCVIFPFILEVRLVGRTRRDHTGVLIPLPSAVLAFIFLARRI